MDFMTHFLLPYAAALGVVEWRVRRRRPDGVPNTAAVQHGLACALVFGLAAFAPDLDALVDWLRGYGALYALQHRGASHSLVGAPLFGLIPLAFLHGLSRWRPHRFGRFRFRWGFLPFVVVGSWTHLVLDGIAYVGVPPYWPFSLERVTFGPFYWLVLWLFPISVAIVALYAWGRIGRAGVVKGAVLVVMVLIVLAGVRIHYQPDVADGAEMFARASPFEWTVVAPLDDGTYAAWLVRSGVPEPLHHVYQDQVPDDGPARQALERARDTDAYRGHRLGAMGPQVTHVEPGPEGGWNVTFVSVAQHFEARHQARWTPVMGESVWGVLGLFVSDDHVRVTHRGY